MENLNYKTQQNAIVRRTLSLEEFIENYIAPSHNQADLNVASNRELA